MESQSCEGSSCSIQLAEAKDQICYSCNTATATTTTTFGIYKDSVWCNEKIIIYEDIIGLKFKGGVFDTDLKIPLCGPGKLNILGTCVDCINNVSNNCHTCGILGQCKGCTDTGTLRLSGLSCSNLSCGLTELYTNSRGGACLTRHSVVGCDLYDKYGSCKTCLLIGDTYSNGVCCNELDGKFRNLNTFPATCQNCPQNCMICLSGLDC